VLEVDAGRSGEDRAKFFIQKSAWRKRARLAEWTVYKMLCSATKDSTSHLIDLDGAAGDIFDPHQQNEVIKVLSHRKRFGTPINENDDSVLHRLVLAGHGRKL
jgi:hypothetical protein